MSTLAPADTGVSATSLYLLFFVHSKHKALVNQAKRSNHDTSSARSALRSIQDGGRGNFKRAIGPIFGGR